MPAYRYLHFFGLYNIFQITAHSSEFLISPCSSALSWLVNISISSDMYEYSVQFNSRKKTNCYFIFFCYPTKHEIVLLRHEQYAINTLRLCITGTRPILFSFTARHLSLAHDHPTPGRVIIYRRKVTRVSVKHAKNMPKKIKWAASSEKSAFENAQNVRIQIILHMRKSHSGVCLKLPFYSIQ